MSKFADHTKFRHRARNPDDIMELQEDINKLVEWANKWEESFNVNECSMMHIGHYMQSNNNMSNQQLPTADDNRSTVGYRNHHHHRPQVAKTEKSCKTADRVVRFIARNFWYNIKELILQYLQIPSPPTSLTFSAILVPTFTERH